MLHRERLADCRISEARYRAMTPRRGILYEEDWLRWLEEARRKWAGA